MSEEALFELCPVHVEYSLNLEGSLFVSEIPAYHLLICTL